MINSEIDGAHPDLTGAIANKYDATGVDDNPHAHGTGMAGAIVSHQKLLGVAPGARILAIRAFSTRNANPESTTFHILRGLDWAVANNVRIVNMSFAGPRDPSLERALKAAHDKGMVLIAAAGNAGPRAPALYPAADPHVIAVTATDVDDRLFTGANRGNHVAIAAPGVDILVPAPAGEYQVTTGTSVATAHISGVVALMLERNPRLTPVDVRRILIASAKRIGPANMFGAGLVDPMKAIEMAAPRSAAAPARCNDQADDHRSGGAAVRPRTVSGSCRRGGGRRARPAAASMKPRKPAAAEQRHHHRAVDHRADQCEQRERELVMERPPRQQRVDRRVAQARAPPPSPGPPPSAASRSGRPRGRTRTARRAAQTRSAARG